MENTSLVADVDTSQTVVIPNCTEDEGGGSNTVRLLSVDFIAPIAVLTVFNLVVIVGNSLVITAVFTHTKLRTATNTFIVSLAVSDLMLGIVVLPYSSAKEVLRGYWPFGVIWCRVWLAVDVLLCTASILNLCAISLDRYLAITHPFKYPRLMSPLRAKLLVGLVWILSFIVCFPPLVGWNEQGKSIAEANENDESNTMSSATTVSILTVIFANQTSSGMSSIPAHYTHVQLDTNDTVQVVYKVHSKKDLPQCQSTGKTCDLEAELGYRIYSAFGSFWVPVWIMVFFYWRIYRTAANANMAFKRGVLTTKTADLNSNAADTRVTLRIHRGGAGASKKYTTEEGPSTRLLTRPNRAVSSAPHSPSRSQPPSPSPSDITRPGPTAFEHARRKRLKRKPPKIKITFSKGNNNGEGDFEDVSDRRLKRSQSTPNRHPPSPPSPLQNGTKKYSVTECPTGYDQSHYLQDDNTSTTSKHSILQKFGGRSHVKSHIKRLNKEKKAAKTVGIIVGCFIFCWAPFFTVYLIDVFCNECTPMLLFTIFFWLGYCNSAVNPCIYALCSRDFRYAFKKLLRCRCERTKPIRERRNTRFLSLLNSLRIKVSSRDSDSNSEMNDTIN